MKPLALLEIVDVPESDDGEQRPGDDEEVGEQGRRLDGRRLPGQRRRRPILAIVGKGKSSSVWSK